MDNDSATDNAGRSRRVRLTAVFSFVGLCAVLVVVQYGSLMLRNPEEVGRTLALAQVERGPILDRNGKILAIQTSLDTVTVWKPYIRDIQKTASLLAPLIQMPEGDVSARLAAASGFLVLKRSISPTASEAIERLIEEGELRGVNLRPDMGRSYPERDRGAHVVGYTGTENIGLAGIEYAFNRELSPPAGGAIDDTVYGNQVFLTIDAKIQNIADRLAIETRDEHDAASVMLLVMEAKTGDVLAYSAVPSFDPNNYAGYAEDNRRNRPSGMLYEPGSVFKIFSVASFFQLGGISPTDLFVTDGVYRAVKPPISDLGNYGTISAEGIIKFSSNVGAAYASEKVDEASFFHMLKLFGFGEPTGVGFSGEERGLLSRPERWSGRSKPTIAIGQEVGVTAIQMLTAATAIANRGVLLKPNIVKKIVTHDGRLLAENGRTPVRQVLDPSVADTMLDLMFAATTDNGTARRIRVEGLNISAKTGTAEIYDPQTGGYSEDEFLASCLAIFPTEDPQYIVYLVIERPQGDEYYGGRIAVPVVRSAIEGLLANYPDLTGSQRIVEHAGRVRVRTSNLPAIGDVVPDFTGLPKRALLPLYESARVDVDIRGTGWVVDQQPAPGTRIEDGMMIRLELE